MVGQWGSRPRQQPTVNINNEHRKIMGRSVSTHRHAVATAFIQHEGDQDDWFDFIDNLRDTLTSRYPTLSNADRWQDREDHIIMDNRMCEVSVSEYCGLVAVCLAPQDPDSALCIGWCERAADGFRKLIESNYGGLRRVGTFSNGSPRDRRSRRGVTVLLFVELLNRKFLSINQSSPYCSHEC